MTPAIYNFDLYQGKTYKQTFLFGDGFDLSASNIVRMNIRKSPSNEIIFDSTAAGNEQTLIISGNTIIFNLPESITELFEFDNAGYDIEIVKAAQPHEVDEILCGKITLVREYTKDEHTA